MNNWINGTPKPGEVVEVWNCPKIEPAQWDGRHWRDAHGNVLWLVSHYLPADASNVEGCLVASSARPGTLATGF
jgi:hypothetical protein